jgi:hypothetical protein
MSCNIYVHEPIFTICKVDNSLKKYYVFIGIVSKDIEIVLDKIEKRKNLDKYDTRLLKLHYKKYYMNWIEIAKNREYIKFIYNKIRLDNSLQEVKQKIFIYISQVDKNDWILPNNQEIWIIENIDNKEVIKVIGYKYEDCNEPHIYNKSLNTVTLEKKTLITFDNYKCLYDLIDIKNLNNNTIYFSNINDEIKRLQKKNVNLKPKYLYYYWPLHNIKLNKSEILKQYEIVKYHIENENKLFQLIDNNSKRLSNNNINKTNDNVTFGSCNIITIQLSVNNYNFIESKNIDLYNIFDYLKDNILDNNTPFIKYKDNQINLPFVIISKQAIDDKLLNKDLITSWIITKTGSIESDNIREFNKIQVKRFIDKYDDEYKFSTIDIEDKGEITLIISYENRHNANFYDIQKVIDNSRQFISNINKLDFRVNRTSNFNKKLPLPNIDIKDNNEIIFNEYTRLKYLNYIIPYKYEGDINFNELYKFIKYFPNFITDIPDELPKDNSIMLRYRRVSGFINLDKIMIVIDKLKESAIKDTLIIDKIMKDFDKTVDEAKMLIKEWKKKYAIYKNSKIDTEFKTGIKVIISKQNIKLHGITNLYQIVYTYRFFTTFIYLYFNKEKVNFKNLKINNADYIINNMANELLNNYKSLNKYQNYEFDFNKNIMNALNNTINNNNDLDYLIDSIDKNQHNKIIVRSNEMRELATDDQIGSDIKLKCDDAIIEYDTCADFCNDTNYILRRLQRYDNNLFRFGIDKKELEGQYSRRCQRQSQPIVLSYDPDKSDDIKRDSYKYAYKYSTNPEEFNNWYICPTIWCPYCQKPLSNSEVDQTTIRKKKTTGVKEGVCIVAECPYGNHQVFIRDTNHVFPGFIDKEKHPKGYCLPCCFAKPHNLPKSSFYPKFSKCLGIDVEIGDIKEDVIYILGKSFPCTKNRYALLPIEVSRILNTNIDTGYLENKKGFFRKGIVQYENNNFLSAIIDILSCNKNNNTLTINKIKNLLIQKLDDKLFRSLYHGSLYITFNDGVHNPKTNFEKYLLSDKVDISHTYLWDLLQRPNILFNEGVNIFIFENNNLLCPLGEIVDEFYNKKLNTILLIKYKNYYEPIYYLEGTGKSANIQCIFPPNKIEIQNLYDISLQWCTKKKEIRWDRILLDNIINYKLNLDNNTIDEPLTLNKTLYSIKSKIENKDLSVSYKPKKYLVDTYNKVFAIQLDNDLIIPVYPSKLNIDLDYIIVDDYSKLKLINYDQNIKLLDKINKTCDLNNIPISKIVSLDGKNIVALYTKSNRIIPVKASHLETDKLKISKFNYYTDADNYIYNNIHLIDKRIRDINNLFYEDETYNRIKFEIARYFKISTDTNKMGIYDEINKNINASDISIDIRRNNLINILLKLFNKLVSSKKREIDIQFYEKQNKRVPCFTNKNKLTCEKDVHCVYDDSCKVHMFNKNLLNNKNNKIVYMSMIAEELLRFKIRRNEILNDEIPNIIDKNIIVKNPNKYYIINSYSINEIYNAIDTIFTDMKDFYINKKKLWEITTSKYDGVDITKYIESNITINDITLQNDLSSSWIKIFSFNYIVQKNIEDSLFISLSYALNTISNKKYNKEEVKNALIDYLKQFDTNKLNNSQMQFLSKLNSFFKNKNKTKNIVELYNESNFKFNKKIVDIADLCKRILLDNYTGCEIDIYILGHIFKINIIVLEKRFKKKTDGYKCYMQNDSKIIFLYKNMKFDKVIYDIIKRKNKFVFEMSDLSSKIIDKIVNKCRKECNNCVKII